jgi:hypothetical protein
MPQPPLTPPPCHPDEPPFVCIQINTSWIPYIIGLLRPAKFPEYWSGTLDENRNARRDVQNLIDQFQVMESCEDMTNCCLDLYIIQRVNVDTGNVEISIDGGTTWQPAPGSLPTKIIEPAPPVTSGTSATKCDAATNAMEQVQGWIDHVTLAFDIAAGLVDFAIAVASAILDAILLILSEGALTAAEAQIIAIITGAITAIWEGGKAIFADYWTPEIKDDILCSLYCTIGEDGHFTDAQFAAFRQKISAKLPGGAAKALFLGFIGSVGRQGLNAMAASGNSALADCAHCACDDDCASSWASADISNRTWGKIVARDSVAGSIDIESDLLATDSFYYCVIKTPTDMDCCIFDHSIGNPTPDDGTGAAWVECGVTQDLSHLTFGIASGHCVNLLVWKSTAPFQIRVFFTPCV